MTQKAKHAAQRGDGVAPVVLFGLDANGKPKAARFGDQQAGLASKAAKQLQLQVLAVTDAKLADVAARLPAGRIHANGRGLVPYIRRDLYDRLVAAAAPAAPQQPSSLMPTGDGGGGPDPGGSNPDGSSPSILPKNWDGIRPGHHIIVQESLEDGWYDAIVFECTNDMLTVRWRDYPRDRKFARHRLTVALAYPDSQAPSAAVMQQPRQAAVSAKAGASKGTNPASANIEQSFPTNWDEIDVDHLVLAKQDGPWAGWWEAIPIENQGDTLTLRWRDYPNLPTIMRPRLSLALLYPKP